MKLQRWLLILWATALFAPILLCQNTTAPAVTAFVNVNVIPMDRERVLQKPNRPRA
ncbi:MAG: hypothetical protein U0Y68_09115 [Blastocatellia bacterium]